MGKNEKAAEREERAMMAALRVGVDTRSPRVLGILIASGLSDREAAFAMKLCSSVGNKDLVALLLGSKSDWSEVEGVGESLGAAAENGNARMVRDMLAAKFPLEWRDGSGMSALMRAARADEPEVVKMLAAAGAKIEAGVELPGVTADGWSAMHIAALAGRARMVDLLASLGADADARAKNGDTPLMAAARYERGGSGESVEVAKAAESLLAAGADAGAVDALGDSVAVLAARSRNSMILSSLLRAGVDKDQRAGSDGQSLLEISLGKDVYGIRERCAQVLLDAGAMPPERLALTPKGRLKDFVKVVEGYGYVQVLGHLRAIKESRELGKLSKPLGEAAKPGKAKKTSL
jgi:ankyrin repeat protein